MADVNPSTDREARHRELADRYLPAEQLDLYRQRAAANDRGNGFGFEDLRQLQASGYLSTFVPAEYGGPGLTLNQVSRLQQRLAGATPGTALAVNMHLMCVGVARVLHERGDHSLDWVFSEAQAGEVFAFGISEPGNDWMLQGSNTVAAPQPGGGYAFTGKKVFTSLSPAWTRLIVHGTDSTDPENPLLVYGFLERDGALAGDLSGSSPAAPAVTTSSTWDVLGMRGSQSRSTTLDGAVVNADKVVRTIRPGNVPDLLTFAITANFQLLIGSVYAGVAQRALHIATDALPKRRSAKEELAYSQLPGYRVRLADAAMDLLPVTAQLDAYTRDVDELTDHGKGWPQRLLTARINASTAARRATETALACTGGQGFENSSEISRLYRDAAAGLFHPASEDAARGLIAAGLLDD